MFYPLPHIYAPPKKAPKRPRMSAYWIQARGGISQPILDQLELVDGHHHNEQLAVTQGQAALMVLMVADQRQQIFTCSWR